MLILGLIEDGLSLRNVARLAAILEMELVTASSLSEFGGDEPGMVVIDLETEDGSETVAKSKVRWPLAMVVGLVALPGGDTWKRGEAAGCDVVSTRGAVVKAATARWSVWLVMPGGRRTRLFSLSDIAGRLGVVERTDDPTHGLLAVYHIGGEICVAQDTCPHAGARLSVGEVNVDDGVVTCPEHGSRFEVCSGTRVRGPSDEGLKTFRTLIEDGQVFILFD